MSSVEQVGSVNGTVTPMVDIAGSVVPEVSIGGSVSIPDKVYVGGKPRIGEVELLASAWVGEVSPYSQVVEIEGVTENSQVDLTPSMEQLLVFYEKDLAFVTENDGGMVTVFAIGQKPANDYTIQVTITEVEV